MSVGFTNCLPELPRILALSLYSTSSLAIHAKSNIVCNDSLHLSHTIKTKDIHDDYLRFRFQHPKSESRPH